VYWLSDRSHYIAKVIFPEFMDILPSPRHDVYRAGYAFATVVFALG
jgi:hypothetical protein